MTLDECLAVATDAVHGFRPAWMLGADDRSSVAHWVAWEMSLRPGVTPGLVATCARRRAIDEVRSQNGQSRYGRGRPPSVPLIDDVNGVSDPESVGELVDAITDDERTRLILRAVADGSPGKQIAAEHGITPGRVTQIVQGCRAAARRVLQST